MNFAALFLAALASVNAAPDWHCPVCGMNFSAASYPDHPLVHFAGGQSIAIGGAGCVKKFNADPAAFLNATADASAPISPSKAGETLVCPVSGESFVAKEDGPVVKFNNGQAVYVCCDHCVDKLATNLTAFISKLPEEDAEEEARERAAADEAARRERAEEASERAAADARIEEERSEREAAERAAAARRLDAERAQQADEARAARRARRDARRAAEADDRSQKEQASRAWRRGVASVDAALRTLAASAGDAYGDAVAALRDILEAIVEKPDDDARRRLRCANAAFARDVDNFEGGRQVLFSAGFQLTHRSSGVEPAQDDEEDDWQVWESLLVLREPNPLSDGFDAWTAWFDNLKACHARLRDEAERLEASRPSKGLLAGAAPSWVDTKRSLY